MIYPIKILKKIVFKLTFFLSLIGLFILIFDFGFNQPMSVQTKINGFYFWVIISSIATTIIRYITLKKTITKRVVLFDIFLIIATLAVLYAHFFSNEANAHLTFWYNDIWMKVSILLTVVREFSEQKINYKRKVLNPAQLFIISFILIILAGTFLLMLPNATNGGIGFLDALFTATSAVCVTGLIVVDTSTHFTQLGQLFIIILIQIGGVGILTFASYFSYFFKGVSTYENQLVFSDMTNSSKLSDVFSTLKRILIITFSVEILGALLIFLSLNGVLFPSFVEKIFFSIFDSLSGFWKSCFSTLSNGLYETGYRYNYFLHLIIIALLMLGGLGFPILANLFNYTKHYLSRKILGLKKHKKRYKPWVLNINSRITLITSFTLFFLGTIIFFISEYNNTLANLDSFGKFVTAFFGAATPRTAGFNTVDMTQLNVSTLILTLLLMWIGASPASTGGGIKTSTFAIATLNFLSLAKGKTRIEIYRREISDITVRRAFATISLSLVVIGTGIFGILIFDPDKELMAVTFECFSAYSTVGLSIGLTAALSAPSKLILIAIMFIGRVSMLTILIAVFKKIKLKNYRYPSEEITIN